MVVEPRAAKRLTDLQEALRDLMADPVLEALQTKAEAQHRAAIERLKQDPHYGALFATIKDWRPTGSFTTFKDGDKTVYDF